MRPDQLRPRGLPADWNARPLRETVSSLTSGSRPGGGGSADAGGVFSIGGEHITPAGALDFSSGVYVPLEFFDTIRDKAEVHPGDILINKDGANTGKLARARAESLPNPACINEHVFRLRMRPTEVDQAYAFYFLLSPFGQKQIIPLVQGSAQPGLNQRFTKYVHLWFPRDTAEQAAIARILDAVDTALERTRAAVERARELCACLITDLLSHGIGEDGKVRRDGRRSSAFVATPLGRLPATWQLSTVAREFDLQSGFTLNAERRARFRKRPYLRVANVQRDSLDLTDVQELEAGDAEFAPRVLALVSSRSTARRRFPSIARSTRGTAGRSSRGASVRASGCRPRASWPANSASRASPCCTRSTSWGCRGLLREPDRGRDLRRRRAPGGARRSARARRRPGADGASRREAPGERPHPRGDGAAALASRQRAVHYRRHRARPLPVEVLGDPGRPTRPRTSAGGSAVRRPAGAQGVSGGHRRIPAGGARRSATPRWRCRFARPSGHSMRCMTTGKSGEDAGPPARAPIAKPGGT
jgi:hypothetical protein